MKNEQIVKKYIRKHEKEEKPMKKKHEKEEKVGRGTENVMKVKVLKHTPKKITKKGVGGSQQKTKLLENNPKKVSKLIEMFENIKGATKEEIKNKEK